MEPLVASQSMNDMLIINIIYTSKANFEVVKRREKLRFLTRESVHMKTLLTKVTSLYLPISPLYLTRESVHMKTLLTKVRPRPRLGSGLGEA